VRIAGLALDAKPLAARVDARMRAMIDAGWIDEVRALVARPAGWSRTARQAIGYKELAAFVAGPETSLESVMEAISIRSRQFARRQRAWYRRSDRVVWCDATQKTPPLLDAVVAWWEAP
jgi:tRNA dimethylallyltransferase